MRELYFQWAGDDGFVRFRHRMHKDHLKPFPDIIDTTAIWLTSMFLNKHMTKWEIKGIIKKGIKAREQPNGTHIRDKGVSTPIGRDQLDFMVPLMRAVGLNKMADTFVELYGGPLAPHWSSSLYNRRTVLGDIFECGDSISDWFSNSESSQMNNIARLLWGSVNGKKNKLAIKLLKMKINPYRVIEIYGSREPDTPEEDYWKLPGIIDINSPAPCFLGYKPIIEKYL